MKVQDTIILTIVFIMILIFLVTIFSIGTKFDSSKRLLGVYNFWGIISPENWQTIQMLVGLTFFIIIIMKLI